MNIILNGVFIAMGLGVRGVSFAAILSRSWILVLMILFSGKVGLMESLLAGGQESAVLRIVTERR